MDGRGIEAGPLGRAGTDLEKGACMADNRDLFLRKATGLVRSWSVMDAFVYAFFSINLVTLGLYTISQAWYFGGGMIPALVISGVLMLSEIVVYAALIAVMPRAGGDYVWQSRILGGAFGFILTMVGWCFINWLWTPLYADMLRHIVLVPIAAVLGFKDAALAIAASPVAWFWVCAFTCLFIFVVVAFGMKTYARVQKVCFWIGNAGLLVVIGLLLAGNRDGFKATFDAGALELFGLKDAYAGIEAAGKTAGASTPLWGGSLGQVFLLMPYLAFFNLWPNWGATLYGEVKGAGDFRKNFGGMAIALGATTLLAVVLLLAIDKAIGWGFFTNANAAYWSARWGGTASAMPVWPYPAVLALMGTHSTALRLVVLVAMSAWFFGWAGTIFLSASRILFSASFDRLLPEFMAKVDPKTRMPLNALLFMIIPGLVVSALYCFNVFNLQSLCLVSTLVIAITFFGTGIAAILLPFTKKDLYAASPLAKFRLGKLPLISVFGLVFCGFLGYLLYEWIIDPNQLYGISYRNVTSLVFMAALYLIAALIYVGMRLRRKREGIDMNKVYSEIPVE
jgi:APA family basic amino acid/polyamine antiporter